MQTKKKHAGGRPRSGVKLTIVTFKADEKTIAALDRLHAALGEESTKGEIANGGRSQAIRWAILETAARLPL